MEAQVTKIADTKEHLIFKIIYGTPRIEYHQEAIMKIEIAIEKLTNEYSMEKKMGYNVYDCRNNSYSKIVVFTK